MSEPHFSFADLNDVEAIAALTERAYRGDTAAKGWTNESAILSGARSSPAEVEALVCDPESRFLLVRHGDRLVGSALLQRHGAGAYFGMFAVDPEHQGIGLGKAMMAQAETAVRELWQARYLKLTVISLRHELIAWYERRGFVLTGTREPFPFDLATGAFRTDFDLVVLQKPL